MGQYPSHLSQALKGRTQLSFLETTAVSTQRAPMSRSERALCQAFSSDRSWQSLTARLAGCALDRGGFADVRINYGQVSFIA
jgi:hypothetical protein